MDKDEVVLVKIGRENLDKREKNLHRHGNDLKQNKRMHACTHIYTHVYSQFFISLVFHLSGPKIHRIGKTEAGKCALQQY